MIRLTRVFSDYCKDDPEVFIEPGQITAVVEHGGKTTVVLSGPELIYNISETVRDVINLKQAWTKRHLWDATGASYVFVLDGEPQFAQGFAQ